MVYLNFNLIKVTSHSTGRQSILSFETSSPSISCVARQSGICSIGLVANISIYSGSATYVEQQRVFNLWMKLINSSFVFASPTLVVFNSTEEMEAEYMQSSNLLAGLVLDASRCPNKLHYDIRVPSSSLPSPIAPSHPSLFFPSLSDILGGTSLFSQSGFASLQVLADQAIGNILASDTARLSSSRALDLELESSSLVFSPLPLYLNASSGNWPQSNMFSAITMILAPAYLAWAFFGAVYLCSADIVIDRTSKIKEYLKIMGMREVSYWIANALFMAFVSVLPFLFLLGGTLLVNLFGPNSALGILYLFLFALCCIAYTLFIGAVAPSTQVSSAVSSLYFVVPFVAVFLVNLPLPARIALSLIAPVNFQFALIELIRLKCIHEIGSVRQLPSAILAISPYPIGGAIAMFFVDMILYACFAWYFAQVLGGSDTYGGTPKRWNFLFTRAYWFKSSSSNKKKNTGSLYSNDQRVDEEEDDADSAIDEATGLLRVPGSNSHLNTSAMDLSKPRNPAHFEPFQGDPSHLRIRTRHLVKRYKGAEVNAVNGLDLDIFQGIYVLLGENGSGKSTTISMLTGLIPHTSGSAEVDGADLDTQLDFVRHSISVCPQHDLLSERLSGAEHLRLFALLKGVSPDELEARVAQTLAEVGLAKDGDALTETYSGGMKRSLSLGISLVAQSRVVFIDEASSGMDMEKRRSLWDMLLQKKKEGSTLILTTHYMEEAEILGDRIGIMHRGNLVREGSLAFLKRELGYQITASGPRHPDSASASSPSVSQSASRSTSHSDNEAFEAPTTTQLLPLAERDKLPGLLSSLEQSYEHVSLTTPNLEEVFISLGKSLDSKEENASASLDQHWTRELDLHRSNETTLHSHSPPQTHPRPARPMQQLGSLLKRRTRMEMRDTGSLMCFLLVPIIFTIFGLAVSRISASYMAELPHALTISKANSDPQPITFDSALPLQIPFSSSSSLAGPLLSNFTSLDLSFKYLGATLADLSNYLWNGSDATLAKIGGVYMGKVASIWLNSTRYDYNIEFNQTEVYSLPRLVNLLNNAIIRNYVGSSVSNNVSDPLITVRSVPFPAKSSSDDSWKLQVLTNNLITMDTQFGTLICIIICILGGLIGKQVAMDYEKQIVQQLQRIGLSSWMYWVSGMIFDAVRMTVAAVLMMAVVAAFRLTLLQGTAFLVFSVSLLLQSWVIVPIAVVLGKVFSTSASAQKFLPIILTLSIIIPTILASIFRSLAGINKSAAFLSTLANIVTLLTPTTMLISTLTSIATAYTKHFTLPPFGELMTFGNAGLPIFLQVLHIVFWVSVLRIIESYKATIRLSPKDESPDQKLPYAPSFKVYDPLSDSPDGSVSLDKPLSMVSEEDGAENQAVELFNLWKRYPNALRRAVVGSSFSVPNGICFGLLGPNGAGKSTTISMLIGDVTPSGGQYLLNGEQAIGSNRDELYQHVRLACCLQANSLFENMSVAEHVKLYLELRNDSRDFDVESVTRSILSRMKLLSHSHKLAKQLSGGNMRKLCTAISALTFNDIVVLDEPSTGCDPSMRRTLWEVIRTEQAHKGLILTTHSMDEADAVCNRIAIMVNGQIVSLGTPAALKAQCGGYELQVWLLSPPNATWDPQAATFSLEQDVLRPKFPALQLVDKDTNHAGAICLKYDIGIVHSISDTYSYLHEAFLQSKFSDYALSQMTLGTAYQRLVRDQLEEIPAAPSPENTSKQVH